MRATDTDGLVRYVMSLGKDAAVISPPETKERYLELLRRVEALHEKKP